MFKISAESRFLLFYLEHFGITGASHDFNLFTVCISLGAAKMIDSWKLAGYSVTRRNKRRHGVITHTQCFATGKMGRHLNICRTQITFQLSPSMFKLQNAEYRAD